MSTKGWSRDARRSAAKARSIKALLGHQPYELYKRTGQFNASALEDARTRKTTLDPGLKRSASAARERAQKEAGEALVAAIPSTIADEDVKRQERRLASAEKALEKAQKNEDRVRQYEPSRLTSQSDLSQMVEKALNKRISAEAKVKVRRDALERAQKRTAEKGPVTPPVPDDPSHHPTEEQRAAMDKVKGVVTSKPSSPDDFVYTWRPQSARQKILKDGISPAVPSGWKGAGVQTKKGVYTVEAREVQLVRNELWPLDAKMDLWRIPKSSIEPGVRGAIDAGDPNYETGLVIPHDVKAELVSDPMSVMDSAPMILPSLAKQLDDLPDFDAVSFTGTEVPPDPHLARRFVETAVSKLNADTYISGGAEGVDTMVSEAVRRLHPEATNRVVFPGSGRHNAALKTTAIEAVTAKKGKSDPDSMMLRNDQLAAEGEATIAFPETGKEAQRSGTWATVRRARAAGNTVVIVPLNGDPPRTETPDKIENLDAKIDAVDKSAIRASIPKELFKEAAGKDAPTMLGLFELLLDAEAYNKTNKRYILGQAEPKTNRDIIENVARGMATAWEEPAPSVGKALLKLIDREGPARVKPASKSKLTSGTKILSSNSKRPGVIQAPRTLKGGGDAYFIRFDDGGMGTLTPDRIIVVEEKKATKGKPDSTGVGRIYKQLASSGIRVDVDGLDSAILDAKKRVADAQTAADVLTGVPDFKPGSVKMVNEYLARSNRGPVISTREDALAEIMSPAELRDVFALKKEKKTLQDLRTLRRHTDKDGRVRPTWTEAHTGRWYTGEPPIQTLSAEVRQFMVPEDGHGFSTLDFHQHELRILAAMSGDKALQDAIAPGKDPHLEVYQRTTGNKLSSDPDRRKIQRDTGKMLNYALVYGIGPEGLAGRLNITNDQAKELIRQHFAAFPEMAAWIRKIAQEGLKNGYVTTIAGRKIPIDVSTGKDEGGRSWREAVNYTLQGSSSDHFADLIRRIHASGEKYFEHLKATMHDALLLDLPLAERKQLEAWFTKEMEKPFHNIKVPTDGTGPSANWKNAMDGIDIDVPDDLVPV